MIVGLPGSLISGWRRESRPVVSRARPIKFVLKRLCRPTGLQVTASCCLQIGSQPKALQVVADSLQACRLQVQCQQTARAELLIQETSGRFYPPGAQAAFQQPVARL